MYNFLKLYLCVLVILPLIWVAKFIFHYLTFCFMHVFVSVNPAYSAILGDEHYGFLDVLGQFLAGNLTVIVVSIFAFLPLWFIVYSFKRFRGIIKERRKITKKDVMIFVSSALLMALMMKSLPLAKEIYFM